MALYEHYYLGSMGKDGFSSYFDDLLSRDFKGTLYIIKGSSGNGKSTILKKVAAAAAERDFSVDYIHCSADPDSLDGVACPEKGFVIIDGTAPHTVEPQMLWGRHRVISLYKYLDNEYLEKQADSIMRATDANKELLRRAGRFVSAAASLTQDVYRTTKPAVKREKLNGSFSRLGKRLFPRKKGRGRVLNRYYSAVTPNGVMGFFKNNFDNYRYVYIVNDNGLAAGSAGLEVIKNCAVSAGYEVEAGYSPLMPGQLLETVAVRELSVLFVLNSYLEHRCCEHAKIINAHRFVDSEKLKEKRGRASLCRRCTGEMLATAAQLMGEAKSAHDEIEKHFKNSCDFTAQNAETTRLLRELGL